MRKSDEGFERSATDRVVAVMVGLLWIGAVAMTLFGAVESCRADCRPGLVDRLSDHELEGTEGFFVATSDMRCLLGSLELTPLLQQRVGLLEAQLEIADARHARMLEATELGTRTLVNYEAALESTTRRALEAEDSADAWYRSPFLWFGVGAIAAAVASVAVVSVLP